MIEFITGFVCGVLAVSFGCFLSSWLSYRAKEGISPIPPIMGDDVPPTIAFDDTSDENKQGRRQF